MGNNIRDPFKFTKAEQHFALEQLKLLREAVDNGSTGEEVLRTFISIPSGRRVIIIKARLVRKASSKGDDHGT